VWLAQERYGALGAPFRTQPFAPRGRPSQGASALDRLIGRLGGGRPYALGGGVGGREGEESSATPFENGKRRSGEGVWPR
jgi:hypothetical protein